MTDKSREKAIKHASSMVNNYTSSIALYHGSRHPELINFIPQAREQLNMWESILFALENVRDNELREYELKNAILKVANFLDSVKQDPPLDTAEIASRMLRKSLQQETPINAQCRPACGVCEICTR